MNVMVLETTMPIIRNTARMDVDFINVAQYGLEGRKFHIYVHWAYLTFPTRLLSAYKLQTNQYLNSMPVYIIKELYEADYFF